MSGLNILVCGASIAGPMAAYWLAKAGANVTVIERFPELRKNGQAIDIRTVGVTIMDKIPGMEAAVRCKMTGQEGASLVGADGTSFGTLYTTGDREQQSIISEYEIFRGDLAQILFDLTKDNERIRYIFGEQIALIQQHDDGPVVVEFANGTPKSEYDLVVACDGATSRTRAIGLGCGVRDHIDPINTWCAYFTMNKDILDGRLVAQATSAVGGRMVAVGPDPSGRSRVTLMNVSPRDNRDATLPFREAAKQGDETLKKYVFQEYQGIGWITDEVLQGMMESDDFYASEMVQVKVPELSKGRFVLVGDAGYAPGPTGTGTSLAMAGAYLLAGEVSKHKGDLTAGLRGYERQMRPLIDDMQKIPPGIPWFMGPQTAWGITVRNAIFTVVTTLMKFGWLFAWLVSLLGSSWGSATGRDTFQLPDYEWVM